MSKEMREHIDNFRNFLTENSKKKLNISVVMCSVCGSKNITTKEQMRRTGGKLYKGRMTSYGYFLNVHYCNDCQNVWDGERTRNS
jgi:hypothetical protein